MSAIGVVTDVFAHCTGPNNYSLICDGTVFDGFPTRAEVERYAAIMLPFRTYRIVQTSSGRSDIELGA